MKFRDILIGLLLPCLALAQINSPCYLNNNCNPMPITNCQTNCAAKIINKTVELKCDYGYDLIDNVCVRTEQISCPAGSKQIGNRCIREYIEAPQCPIGSELRNGICVRIFDHVCPAGFAMVKGQCIREETVQVNCPPGSTLRNNQCVRVICPNGYNLQNGICIAEETVIETVPPPATPCSFSCPQGYVYENQVCRPLTPVIDVLPPPPVVMGNCPLITPPQPLPQLLPPPQPLLPPLPPQPQQCGAGYTWRQNECMTEVMTCPEGFVKRGDKCEQLSCPTPSTWDGQRCVHLVVQGSNTTNLVNNTHIVNNYNNVTHDTNVSVNNVNNVFIYKGGEVVQVANGTQQMIQPTPAAEVEIIEKPERERCCTVVTPRLCKNVDSKWRCFNRKYERCGSFCTQPRIQLRPMQPIYREQVLVMPPTPPVAPNCGSSGCSGRQVNCSGCQTGGYCSPNCYQYSCESNNCEYQDQQSFCQEHSGPGCGQQDGCYTDV